MKERMDLSGPQTDDELHAWIKANLGVDVPRVSVCDGHCSPFDFIADVYFGRTRNAIAVANRDGGKTFGAAIVHYLRGRFTPGSESCTVGAVEQQAKRAYAHLQKFLDKPTSEGLVDERKRTQQETRWKNGSKIEILPGTVNSVNGPHPQLVHADEVELMDPDVFEESLMMPATGFTPNGTEVPAQYIITSTRKRAHGQMAKLVKEVTDAISKGMEPPWDLRIWCIYESAKSVPNCQVAFPDTPETERCPCDRIANGAWDDGTPRTMMSCCKGRLGRSSGYIPFGDIIRQFTTTSRAVWEAQNECLKPSTKDLVLENMTPQAYGLKNFVPDPLNGPIVMSWDPGGTNPHAVVWYQFLKVEIDVTRIDGSSVRLRAGSRVAFDEIYETEVGNIAVLKKVRAREHAWSERVIDFKVGLRICDPRMKAARLDWLTNSPPYKTTFLGTYDVKEQIDHLRDDVVDMGYMWADMRCEKFWDEVSMWHYKKKKGSALDAPETPVEDADHAMSTLRYFTTTMKMLLLRDGRGGDAPVATKQGFGPAFSDEALPKLGVGEAGAPERTEAWRGNLGAPMMPGIHGV